MYHTKAQVSVEFLMIIVLMVLVFSVYVPFLWKQQIEIEKESEKIVGERIASTVKSEVETAVMFGSGYKRNFTLPGDMLGYNYTIEVFNKIIRIKWKDTEIDEFLIAHQISGSLSPGKNTISNRDDVIVFE